ncbi:D-hexose-6-phosphate mutarotase [Methyloversatilis sp.]|uniref:D-hexose-6-phosphate mutarotase n=1 Tax=Methyloversatilis sp. TaxID=2569862 RepID=UPI0027BA7A3D|nr:D-hexose-6-phosphate mutarotase [Methyloversatilis sp.]
MTDKTGHILPTEFHGQPALSLEAADGARCVVSLFGGHILSWVPAGGKERLYLSPEARFDGQAAIRGGIPVIFPQFAARGDGPRHGFARTRVWQLTEQRAAADFVTVTLTLQDDDATRALWPHAFLLELTVMLSGNRLDLELSAENTGDAPFVFAAALHTYLRVGEVENCRVEGLRGKRYLDATAGDRATQDKFDAVVVEDEIDRVYVGAPDSVVLNEPGRALGLQSTGFTDLVVWNPWEHKARALTDLPDRDFRHFLCLEPALADKPLELAPGALWSGLHTLVAA